MCPRANLSIAKLFLCSNFEKVNHTYTCISLFLTAVVVLTVGKWNIYQKSVMHLNGSCAWVSVAPTRSVWGVIRGSSVSMLSSVKHSGPIRALIYSPLWTQGQLCVSQFLSTPKQHRGDDYLFLLPPQLLPKSFRGFVAFFISSIFY